VLGPGSLPHTTWGFYSSIQCNNTSQVGLVPASDVNSCSWYSVGREKKREAPSLHFAQLHYHHSISNNNMRCCFFFWAPQNGWKNKVWFNRWAMPAVTILSHTLRVWVARGCFYIKLSWPPRTHFLCGRYKPCPTFCAVGVYFFKCKHHGSNIKQN